MRPIPLADLVPSRVIPVALNRATLARAVDGSGIARFILSLRRAASPWLTVLTYHRVASEEEATRYDDGVVDSTPEQLGRQLAFVKRWFDVIGIDDLLAFVRGRGSLPGNPLLITFDDGYRDNHDTALPILLAQGVRATFFIATDYVAARRIYWWDRVSLILKNSPRDRLRLAYPDPEELPLDTPVARRRAIRRVQRIIKDRYGLDLPRFLDGLERAADWSVSADEEHRLADTMIMTWDQVRELRRAGMDVQSHSHTHRVLQTLRPAELDEELRLSRAALEAVLDEPVRAISYPVGKTLRDLPHVIGAVRAAGYELGFSNGTGIGSARAFDPFDVKRLSMDRALPDSLFRAMLALPWLAY